jgi:phage baseplate assembly protein W|tara:strand:- start:446 stop:892 length:447 start_codon:yes stop_codon:yes gene_type:complete
MSTYIQSDKRVSPGVNSSRVSRSKQWSDLDLSLTLHPIRKDIMPLRDDAALRNSIKNLLLTNFYERPFNMGIGANMRALLFEPADSITRIAIRDNIARTISDHEPRVELIYIKVDDQADSNAYNIIVKFRIKEYDTEDKVEIVLRRIR